MDRNEIKNLPRWSIGSLVDWANSCYVLCTCMSASSYVSYSFDKQFYLRIRGDWLTKLGVCRRHRSLSESFNVDLSFRSFFLQWYLLELKFFVSLSTTSSFLRKDFYVIRQFFGFFINRWQVFVHPIFNLWFNVDKTKNLLNQRTTTFHNRYNIVEI